MIISQTLQLALSTSSIGQFGTPWLSGRGLLLMTAPLETNIVLNDFALTILKQWHKYRTTLTGDVASQSVHVQDWCNTREHLYLSEFLCKACAHRYKNRKLICGRQCWYCGRLPQINQCMGNPVLSACQCLYSIKDCEQRISTLCECEWNECFYSSLNPNTVILLKTD